MVLIDAHKTYYLLAALRIILVLVPQTGYIHPDEYFQSIEVLSGKLKCLMTEKHPYDDELQKRF